MADQSTTGRTHRHRRDPSEGGWDTTITRAPDSHKAGAARRHRHEKERSIGQKVLIAIGVILLIIVGVALAVGLGLLIALIRTGSI